ncbi:Methyltransferase domain protein [Desulfosarcina cetonica]|uniref:class I SAM-dependent methyltransferase n=1 Tax=Desulfosarcina cetonica TaxID=90730 RepID=UPI0006CFFA4B|nr:class I SAM-dependent methyltransferase [Desulfosarcina cetonica]VTR67050.1 Methyltransferase domain protein [Desulfosarcina cetonica]
MNKIKTSIRNYWDWRSSSYGVDADKSAAIADQWQIIVHQMVKGAPGKRALDIGTGTGQLAVYLARAGFDVTAIDISAAMIAEARKHAADQRLQIEFSTGDAEALDFADRTFDVIVSRNLLWTLPRPHQALMEWRRVLKPGGRLMLSDGYWMNTTWKRVHRLFFKMVKSRGRNGGRVSLHFFRAYAGLQKRLPLYEGVSLDTAVDLLQTARFQAVTPYDTDRLSVHPYGATAVKNGFPPFFIASATR